ncbi:peroxisomal membrane protein PMP34 [Bradysia coprophila]|uniref:peroxisomal membrane protein PMP34 n=1 Tax=Bradysia coprophila TaxID=38358 RepID=UPI00187D817E|nr:peroxisomal membrane protein PMP34 [Bradysia coprophila]
MAQSKPINKVFSYEAWVHAVAGATGSVFAMSVFYPLDTARYRLQIEDPKKRKALSTFQLIKQLIREEGVSTLYRGMIPVLQSLCISNFVYFYTFHSLKALSSSSNQSAVRDLLLGSISGVVNVLTTTPFWVVNSRLKMKGLNGNRDDETNKYSNLVEGLLYIAQVEGWQGLWAGAIPSLMLVCNPALQFMMYESLKRRIAKVDGQPSAMMFFLIGAISKTFSSVITYPLQLIQTKLRHGKSTESMKLPSNAGVIQMLLHIVKTSGVEGLFRGLEAKIWQTVLTAALMFATYEKIAKFVMSLLIRKKVTKQ